METMDPNSEEAKTFAEKGDRVMTVLFYVGILRLTNSFDLLYTCLSYLSIYNYHTHYISLLSLTISKMEMGEQLHSLIRVSLLSL